MATAVLSTLHMLNIFMIAKSIYVIISKKKLINIQNSFISYFNFIRISQCKKKKKSLQKFHEISNVTRNLPLKSTDPGTLSPPFVNLKKV